MITGFNTNVRYRGTQFHVQTEDSGRSRPHITSHLYYEGTIVASERSDYEDRLGSEDLVAEVRVLMEKQHKSMLGRLQAGDFDAAIGERLGASILGSDTAPQVSTPVPEPVPAASPGKDAAVPSGERAFGEGMVSEKPLDELILEYLVDKARDRAPEGSPASPRKRAKG